MEKIKILLLNPNVWWNLANEDKFILSVSRKRAIKTMANQKSKQNKRAKQSKKKSSSTKNRSKLVFVPLQRIRRHLIEHNYAHRIARNAPIALSAVLEYLTTELLTLAAQFAMESKSNRIRPRHILLAVRHDSEFNELLQHQTIANGGVLPTVK